MATLRMDMEELHTENVPWCDEDGGAQATRGAGSAATNGRSFSNTRPTIWIISFVYSAMFVAFFVWGGFSEYLWHTEGWEQLVPPIYGYFMIFASVEISLTIICTALTVRGWQQHEAWKKFAGLVPLLATFGLVVFMVVRLVGPNRWDFVGPDFSSREQEGPS